MRARPRSRYENDNGSINLALVGEEPEYPEVEAWDRDFANECDKYSTLDAIKTGKRHWGRWYLTRTSLVTRINRPHIGRAGFIKGGIYDISLKDLHRNWVEHMGRKNWIGEKGLADLEKALSTLVLSEGLVRGR